MARRKDGKQSAERGSVERTMIVTLVIFTVAGGVWLGLRGDPAQERVATRLYRYKDSKGQMVYVDTLEKVPPAQREAAAREENVKQINTADFDSYVQAFEAKQEESGGWAWLRGLFSSSQVRVKVQHEKKRSAGSKADQKGSVKPSEQPKEPAVPDGLKSLNPAEIGKSVNSTFESVADKLEGR